MTTDWDDDDPAVLVLPSGRRVRGRGLRHRRQPDPLPGFGLYLLRTPPPDFGWPARHLRWPDFRLPSDRADAAAAFAEVWRRCADERVEVACMGGTGRTGTALACVAVLDGVPPGEAVDYVRQHYSAKAVETIWQRRYVERFAPVAPA